MRFHPPATKPKAAAAALLCLCGAWLFHYRAAPARAAAQAATVAVLDLGATETGRRAADRVAKRLAGAGGARVGVLDRGLAQSAARGVGYEGALSMSLGAARDLGAAIGCDFYVTGDAQVIRRSSSERPAYFEAYATLFVVSTRTGRLVRWSRPAAEADTPERAGAELLPLLDDEVTRLLASVADAWAGETSARPDRAARDEGEGVLDLTAGGAGVEGLREPAPYNRLRPAYTDAASRAEAEATVDVEVEINDDGRVVRVEVVRWAGFGLDEEVVSTVRRMNFRAATVGGEPRPSRVLLRYNFRRPARKED